MSPFSLSRKTYDRFPSARLERWRRDSGDTKARDLRYLFLFVCLAGCVLFFYHSFNPAEDVRVRIVFLLSVFLFSPCYCAHGRRDKYVWAFLILFALDYLVPWDEK